jgi:hypothetical protein
VKEVDTHIAFRAIPEPEPSWVDSWDFFLSQHGSWWSRFASQGPVYCLPTGVIDVLPRGFLDNDDRKAELAFDLLCRNRSLTTIGVWDGQPIDYPLPFELHRLRVTNKYLQELSTTKYAPDIHWRSHGKIDGRTWRTIHHQLLGYVGCLTCDEQYGSERKPLRDRWLRTGCRPSFPLIANNLEKPTGSTTSTRQDIDQSSSEEVATLMKDAAYFMRKWQLNRLITWDLPLPQRPLDGVPLRLARVLLGRDHPVFAVPSFYDIPSNTDVRTIIREEQERVAKAFGIKLEHPVTDISARKKNPSSYESAFRMWHIEDTVKRRYGTPGGLVERLVPAFCAILRVGEDRVKQLRKKYVRFLNQRG